MEVNNYITRIKLIVEKWFEKNIVLNDYFVETILKFLEDPNENSPGKIILDDPRFSDIILHYVEKLNNTSTSLKIFLIETMKLLLKNELQYSKIRIQNLLARDYKSCILDNLNCNSPTKLHLACIKLANEQLKGFSGLDTIIKHKVWQNVLYPDVHHKSKQISKAAYDFMSKLVWKLNDCNSESALMEVLEYIVKPIISIEYFNIPVLDAETDVMLSDKIFSHLSALLAILNEPIIKSMNYECVIRVMSLLKKYFFVDHGLFTIYVATKSSNLVKLINTCLFLYCFESQWHLLYNQKTSEFCNKMIACHRNYIVHSVNKRDPFAVVDYAIQSTIILSKFKQIYANEINFPLTFERNGKEIEFSLQIFIHLLVPQLKYASFKCVGENFQNDDRELFVIKMDNALTDFIYSSCYLFATLLSEGGPSMQKSVTMCSLKELLRLKDHIKESQAGLLFQSLYYALDKFILYNGAGELVVDANPIDQDDLKILTHLLDAMKMLLKEHNIPWYENVEIVNIQADLFNLLKQTSLMKKHVVQVIDLINICMQKFLSPNMSLLVENSSTQDSTLNTIGEVIKLYMQHEDWEVRDSALTLLKNCTEISFIKYIPLQKLIAENHLIMLAAKAAMTDPEYYCRCTALMCLTAATKIDIIWQELLANHDNLYLHLVYILRHNSEGMVRKEAVNVLTAVYLNQKVESSFQNTLYEVMLSAALNDLHWEVQLAALNFWKSAIQNQLAYRGMIDGKFPQVTFSKEKRKIVTLNNAEIQRQLTAAMAHLSNIGCLTVLLECMNEIHSINVMDLAYCISKELIEILDKYKFEKNVAVDGQKLIENVEILPTCVGQNNVVLQTTPSGDSVCTMNEEERDKVIDNILKIDQSELIINLHDRYCEMKSEEMDIDFSYYTSKTYVNTDKFLEYFRDNDYSIVIQSKKKYGVSGVDSLDAVLDEILKLEVPI